MEGSMVNDPLLILIVVAALILIFLAAFIIITYFILKLAVSLNKDDMKNR